MIKAKVLVFAILVYPISLWSVCAGYWVCVAGYYGYKISRTCLGFAMRVFYFFTSSSFCFLRASEGRSVKSYVLTRLWLFAGTDRYLGTSMLGRVVKILLVILIREIYLAVDEYVDSVRRGWECPPSEERKRIGERPRE